MHKSGIRQHFKNQCDMQEILGRFVEEIGTALVTIGRHNIQILLLISGSAIFIGRLKNRRIATLSLQVSATVSHEGQFIRGVDFWMRRQNLLY